jgi:hypothetical protein
VLVEGHDIAVTNLGIMVASDVEPILTPEELDFLLMTCAIVDRNGRTPLDDDWFPTYNLNRGAVAGWRLKAGKCSDLSSIRTGDLTILDNEIFKQCSQMIALYQRKLNAVVSIAPERARSFQLGQSIDIDDE